MPGGGIDRQPRRPRFEVQDGEPPLTVKPPIIQNDIGRPGQLAGADAALWPPLAAHLEEIGEIIVERQRQIEVRRIIAVVLQTDPLIGRASPQEDRPHDVQRVLAQHDAAIAVDVGIGEIDGQRRIVVAQVGAEQQGLNFVQHHLEPGEIAGIGIEQSVGTADRSADVAMAVEDDEGVVVLQRAPRARRRPRHRNVERRFHCLFSRAKLAYGF